MVLRLFVFPKEIFELAPCFLASSRYFLFRKEQQSSGDRERENCIAIAP